MNIKRGFAIAQFMATVSTAALGGCSQAPPSYAKDDAQLVQSAGFKADCGNAEFSGRTNDIRLTNSLSVYVTHDSPAHALIEDGNGTVLMSPVDGTLDTFRKAGFEIAEQPTQGDYFGRSVSCFPAAKFQNGVMYEACLLPGAPKTEQTEVGHSQPGEDKEKSANYFKSTTMVGILMGRNR